MYQTSLPQSEGERAELNVPPEPMACTWSHYRRELQQTEEEEVKTSMFTR